MNGEAVVRTVPVKQNFDYVEAIGTKELENAIEELKKETPPPMNTMLNKQSREVAITKKKTRDSMQLVDVPPTNPVPTITTGSTSSGPSKPRNIPKCRACKHPNRGHKYVLDCPRNKKN